MKYPREVAAVDIDVERQRRLETNRMELAKLATAFEEESGLHRPVAESVGDIVTGDADDVDFAQAISDRETSDTLIHLLSENREQVERALNRLADGKYGTCEDCDERIAAERLRFQPEATRCVECQARHDRLNRRSA
jgi:RNA polymerase-binding transcription factor DksA